MLLWLSLLLCSGVCWAEQIYGNCKGQNFESSVNNGSDISRIRVSFGNNRMIKGIRLKFGDEWDPWYGVNASSYQEVILWNEEHIVNVTGSRNAFIRSLTFYTDQDRQFHFGTKSGIRFTAHGDTNGKVLRGINGKIQKQGICGIGFQWGYPVSPPDESELLTTTQENQEQTANNQQLLQPTSYYDTNTNPD